MYQNQEQQQRINEQTQVNYGRKGFVKEVEPPHWDSFDEQTNNKNKKTLYSTSSKWIFREINLFIPEAIAIVITGMAMVFLLVLGIITNTQMLLVIAPFPPLIVLVMFFVYRKVVFMPGKHRHLTQRILPSGALRFSVDDAKKGEIPFDNNPMAPKIRITNPKKNTDFNTGQPVITLKAGVGENIDLARSENTSQQAIDFDNLAITIAGTQKAWDEYNIAAPKKNMEIILFLMCAGAIVAAGLAAYMGYQNMDAVTNMAHSLPGVVQSAAEAANRATQQAAVTITTGS